jgi:hypothetical protein
LVEREVTPGGVALVSPAAVAKRSYIDFMELTEGVSNVLLIFVFLNLIMNIIQL